MTNSPYRNSVTQSLVASSLNTIYPAVAVKLMFSSGSVCLWSGLGTQSFAGDSYVGVGTLGGISAAKEGNDMAANGVDLTLSGIPNEFISLALDDSYRGRPVTIFLWLFDVNGNRQQSTITFRGFMDTMTINDSGETSTIVMKCENRLIELSRVRDSRYTDQEQKMLYPGDRALEYVAGVANKQLYWGSTAPAGTNTSAGASVLDPGSPVSGEG